MNTSHASRRIMTSTAIAALFSACAVSAQESDPAPTGEDDLFVHDTIIVTARKRSESLQDIPLAITAFSESSIESSGLRSLEDVSRFSPGLQFSNQGSQRGGRSESVIRFRGMDINDVSPTKQLASVFLDGVYVSGGLSSLSMEAVERIEVIKGPQSAHFGRSTFGGAVNLITRAPSDQFQARMSSTIAEGGYIDVSGSLEGALIPEILKGRLTLRNYHADGRYKSPADGGRLGEESTISADGVLQFTPNENLTINLRGFWGQDDDGPPSTFALTTDLHNCGPFVPGGVTYFCGALPRVAPDRAGTNTQLEGDALDIYLRNSTGSDGLSRDPGIDGFGLKRERQRISLQADYDFPGTDITLTSVSFHNKEKQSRLLDFDFTPENVWVEGSFQDIEDWGQELRVSGSFERGTWLIGASYFDLKFETPNGSIAYLYPNAIFTNGFLLDQSIATDKATTEAVFASVSYDLTDTITASLEGRYQRDTIDEGQVGTRKLEKTFENFLPRAILQWTPDSETNLYITYAEGNKPGDFNSSVIVLDPAQKAEVETQTGATEFLDEEYLKNYEIGLKKQFLDGRLQTSTAVYFMNWENQQTRTQATITDPGTPSGFRAVPVLISAGETELWGIEFEGSADLTHNTQLSGTLNYAGSEYIVFDCGFCARITGDADQSGNQTPRFPEWSGSISLNHVQDIGARFGNKFNADWFWRLDGLYTGKIYDEAVNLAWTDPYWRVNLRTGLQSDNWRAELFVLNLLDDDSYEAAARFTDFTKGNFNLNDFVTNVTPAAPRQIGLKVSVEF